MCSYHTWAHIKYPSSLFVCTRVYKHTHCKEGLGKTAWAQDEQGDKEEVPGAVASVAAAAGGATAGVGSARSMDVASVAAAAGGATAGVGSAHSMDVASVAAAAGVATAGVGSAHSMDGERCDMELTPSTPQPAAHVRRDWFNPYARNLVSISDCILS